MVKSVVDAPFTLSTPPRWLVATFSEPWNVLSWAVVNGGFQRLAKVAWLYLRKDEIANTTSPQEWMSGEMRCANLSASAGFLTTRREHARVEAFAEEEDCRCWAVGTVGLSNALRAGDPTGELSTSGTINLLLCCSQAVSTEAALELIALASEAKALATLESGVKSKRSAEPATGTGTDYLAIAWPNTGDRQAYAGKHTAIGSAVGRATRNAIATGIREWRVEYGQ